jgi:putative molybdopterin biosynthesis protein
MTAVVKEAAADCDLLSVIAGSSAGRDDYTARLVASAGTLAGTGSRYGPGHPVVLGVMGQTPVLGAPGYPVAAAPPPATWAAGFARLRAGGKEQAVS